MRQALTGVLQVLTYFGAYNIKAYFFPFHRYKRCSDEGDTLHKVTQCAKVSRFKYRSV